MLLTASTLANITNEYPTLRFVSGDSFYWSPSNHQITYQLDDLNGIEHLLHEVSHALLEHTKYETDIALIQMERADDLVQNDLDTYRDWLHARSTCPHCGANGIQTAKQNYQCLICHKLWSVNQALHCQLKRYKNK
jgi:hypothetical protein